MRWLRQSLMSSPRKMIRPCADGEDPGDEIEHGGLAGAVGPDEPHQLPGENLQGKIGQGLEAAETVGKVDDF